MGIPFMSTGAMKSALRARGLADIDIENFARAQDPVTPDEHSVRSFLEVFVALADVAWRSFSAWRVANEQEESKRQRSCSDPLSA